MNRAAKMLSVLRDGQPHSREDIQTRVGFFLTNNAASELRDQGFEVVRWNEGRRVFYRLAGSLAPAESRSAVTERDGDLAAPPPGMMAASSPGLDSADANETGQLSLIAAASRGAYDEAAA